MIMIKSLKKSDTKSLADKQQQKILVRVKYVRVIVYKIVETLYIISKYI